MLSNLFFIIGIMMLTCSAYCMDNNEDFMALVEVASQEKHLQEPIAMGWKNKFWCNYNECQKYYSKKENCKRHISEQHPKIMPLIIKWKCPIRSCSFWLLSQEQLKQHTEEIHESDSTTQ